MANATDDRITFEGGHKIVLNGHETAIEKRWLQATTDIPLEEIDLSDRTPYRKPFKSLGLRNSGILCYRNVVIQGLFHNARIREWLYRHNNQHGFQHRMCQIKYGNCMACELSHILKLYWSKYRKTANFLERMNHEANKRSGVYRTNPGRLQKLSNRCAKGYPADRTTIPTPTSLRHRFEAGNLTQQQGAGDFMHHLSQHMISDARLGRGLNEELLYGLFGIQTSKYRVCNGCGDNLDGAEPTSTGTELLLPMPANDPSVSNQPLSLVQMIQEHLRKSENRRCDNAEVGCALFGEEQMSSIETRIQAAGSMLIIALQPFDMENTRNGEPVKTTRQIRLVEHLDLSTYHINREGVLLYTLNAVIAHSGGMASGHYTTYVRNPKNPDEWREIDDGRIERNCALNDVLNRVPRSGSTRKSPFTLFYNRVYETEDPAPTPEVPAEPVVPPAEDDGNANPGDGNTDSDDGDTDSDDGGTDSDDGGTDSDD